jgi:outer membrane protein assembly factor BamB
MFGGDAVHSGYSLSIGPGKSRQLLYNMTIAYDGSAYSSPVISRTPNGYGRIYIGVLRTGGAELRCFDDESASLLWINNLRNACVTPVVSGNFVFAGLEDGSVCGIDVATGRDMWSNRVTNTSFSPVTAEGGRVYAASKDGGIYCFHNETGLVFWGITAGENPSSPSIVNGRVYVGSSNGKVYCLDASSGASIWNYSTNAKVQSWITVVDEKVYFTCDDGKMYCLNAASSQAIWSKTISTGSQVPESFAVVNTRIYLCIGLQVFCYDARTGVQIWSNTLDSNALPPAVADGKVYVNSMNYTHCLDALNGTAIWNFTTASGFSVPPIVGDHKLILISNSGKLLAFRAPNNKVTFTQSGLPSATSWTVTLTREDNLTLSSTSTQINFPVYSGEYRFSIAPVNGYTTNYSQSQTGNFTVNTADIYTPINFTQTPTVPEGSNWTWAIIITTTFIATLSIKLLNQRKKTKPPKNQHSHFK